ncbi:hypothetical protein MPH47_09710 [Psychrobacillus psychrodurans]|uniref:DUF6804 family protein n=1 Tax=Psychrobacillus psychrodurans TaxID=126157 RepID=UPI001F4DA67C|nr:DUF6804 family protein [Psychrobacillus psychrodurans]MCK1997492.1 hypothetical protein [Psychrobacillus psychrodurans]
MLQLITAIVGVEDYGFIRWAISATTLVLLIGEFRFESKKKIKGSFVSYLIILFMYNPIVPIYLYDRGLWILFDVVLLILLIIPHFRSDVQKGNKEEPFNDRLLRMSEPQRRRYLDESLQLDPIMMNQNSNFMKYANLREIEIEQILQDTEVEKVDHIYLGQAIDEIIVETGDINKRVSMTHDFYWLIRNTIFQNPYQLGGGHGWRLYHRKTNETIGAGFYLDHQRERMQGFEYLSDSLSVDELIDHEIMILVLPEFLNKNVPSVEGKLLQMIEQDAKQNGVEEISISVSNTEYFSYLYKNGYRSYSYGNAEKMTEIIESGAWSYLTLKKYITQEARDRKAKQLLTSRRVKKYIEENTKSSVEKELI